jgi:hypothetical protein
MLIIYSEHSNSVVYSAQDMSEKTSSTNDC